MINVVHLSCLSSAGSAGSYKTSIPEHVVGRCAGWRMGEILRSGRVAELPSVVPNATVSFSFSVRIISLRPASRSQLHVYAPLTSVSNGVLVTCPDRSELSTSVELKRAIATYKSNHKPCRVPNPSVYPFPSTVKHQLRHRSKTRHGCVAGIRSACIRSPAIRRHTRQCGRCSCRWSGFGTLSSVSPSWMSGADAQIERDRSHGVAGDCFRCCDVLRPV